MLYHLVFWWGAALHLDVMFGSTREGLQNFHSHFQPFLYQLWERRGLSDTKTLRRFSYNEVVWELYFERSSGSFSYLQNDGLQEFLASSRTAVVAENEVLRSEPHRFVMLGSLESRLTARREFIYGIWSAFSSWAIWWWKEILFWKLKRYKVCLEVVVGAILEGMSQSIERMRKIEVTTLSTWPYVLKEKVDNGKCGRLNSSVQFSNCSKLDTWNQE